MAISVISWAFKIKTSSSSKLVLVHLADISDNHGRCAFSLVSVADQCSMKIEEIKICLDELLQKKLIFVKPRNTSSNDYEPWLQAQLLIHRPLEKTNYGTL